MHTPSYNEAVEIANGSFVPSDQDVAGSDVLFNRDAIETFEAWVEDLDDTSFLEISRALRTLRSAINRYRAERPGDALAVTDFLQSL